MASDFDVELLRLHVNSTIWMLNPIIEAYHLEASERLFKPCLTLSSPNDTNCTRGRPWSSYAQKYMAGDEVQIVNYISYQINQFFSELKCYVH